MRQSTLCVSVLYTVLVIGLNGCATVDPDTIPEERWVDRQMNFLEGPAFDQALLKCQYAENNKQESKRYRNALLLVHSWEKNQSDRLTEEFEMRTKLQQEHYDNQDNIKRHTLVCLRKSGLDVRAAWHTKKTGRITFLQE